jgi:hypothetical protein
MEIVLRLRGESAAAFQAGSQQEPGVANLSAVLARYGLELKPQHPGTSDGVLQSYFSVAGVRAAEADRIVATLRELDAVEAAYIQPPPGPASGV